MRLFNTILMLLAVFAVSFMIGWVFVNVVAGIAINQGINIGEVWHDNR